MDLLWLSVIVPCLDEVESVRLLTEKLEDVLTGLALRANAFEVIFVEDGSTDGTLEELASLREAYPFVRTVTFRRNFGKAAALDAGFEVARSRYIITMDADLQDDPEEIPRMLAKISDGFDVVSGWKADRKDPLSKTLPSKVFNKTLATLSGVKLHDYNCGFKAYRREAVTELELYGELHRYIPVLLHYQGFRVTEIPVKHHPRQFGKSKYGIERFTRGFFDLLTVILLTRYATRPLHAFGGVGLILATLGGAVLAYLTFLKIFGGATLGDRPLLLAGILLMLVGVQLISTGLLGEMLARSQHKTLRPFTIKDGFEDQPLPRNAPKSYVTKEAPSVPSPPSLPVTILADTFEEPVEN